MKRSLKGKALTRYSALALGLSTIFGGAALTLVSVPAQAGVAIAIGVSVNVEPPPLPVYVQPPLPAVGYIWTPGYWAYANDGGYFWVPGTWVLAPYQGALWTPGYWGWVNGAYLFHEGYWGPRVGFYGGINYGYGYGGEGYAGGHWGSGGFYYNQSVNQFGGVHVTNVYNQTVVNNVTVNRTSFNGGTGGIAARPSPQEAAYAQQQHTPPVAAQQQHVTMASQNQALRASVNHGAPSIAATSRPGSFSGAGVVAARGAPAAAAAAAHPEGPAEHAANAAPHPAAPAHPTAATMHPAAPRPVNEGAPAERVQEQPAHAAPRAAPAQTYHPRPAAQPYHAPAARPAHPAARPQPAHGNEKKPEPEQH